MDKNAETVTVQDEEQTQDAAASTAAETEQERPLSQERPVVEADDLEQVDETPPAETPLVDAASPEDEELPAEGEPAEDEEPSDDEAVDRETALKEALAQAQAQAEEYLDGWQRARAEFANYRRREEARREQASVEVVGRVLAHFLPVLDDLERAFSAVPPEVQDSPWVEGLSLVAQKMLTGMDKEGVTVMPVELGDPFDPNYHMAVLHLPCDDYDEGQIAMVLQRGYTIGERVLRPAMVQVSSGRTEACESEPATEAKEPKKQDE